MHVRIVPPVHGLRLRGARDTAHRPASSSTSALARSLISQISPARSCDGAAKRRCAALMSERGM
jgi:hypothetical protein